MGRGKIILLATTSTTFQTNASPLKNNPVGDNIPPCTTPTSFIFLTLHEDLAQPWTKLTSADLHQVDACVERGLGSLQHDPVSLGPGFEFVLVPTRSLSIDSAMPTSIPGVNVFTDVLVVGAGPSGYMAVLTLLRYGVDVRIIDKRSTRVQFGHASGRWPLPAPGEK